jgi:hypothetical protein
VFEIIANNQSCIGGKEMRKTKVRGVEIGEGDILRVYGGEYWYGYYEVNVVGKVAYSESSSAFVLISKDAEYLQEKTSESPRFQSWDERRRCSVMLFLREYSGECIKQNHQTLCGISKEKGINQCRRSH